MEGGAGSFDNTDHTVIVSRSLTRSRWLLGVAIAILLLSLAAGVAALRLPDGPAGASSPEEAVRRALASLADEDLLGAMDVWLPSERSAMGEPLLAWIDELVRLKVLRPDFDPAQVAGLDLDFSTLDLEAEQIDDDLAVVWIRSGQSSLTINPFLAPLGPLVAEHLDLTWLHTVTRRVAELGDPGDGVAAVRREGRWYVSVGYSIAEAARYRSGAPPPNGASTIVPTGAATPAGAVDRLLRAAVLFDLRSMLDVVSPLEGEVIHRYAPLFLPDAHLAINDARQSMDLQSVEFQLTELQLVSTPPRDGNATVTVERLGLGVTTPRIHASLRLDRSSLHLAASSADGDSRVELTVVDGCTKALMITPGAEPVAKTACGSGSDHALAAFLGVARLPEFDIFDGTPALDISTVEVGGRWFVSPLGTVLRSHLTTLQMVDEEGLATLVRFLVNDLSGRIHIS